MADPVIGYFLEDIAQEYFVKSLVERVATEVGLSTPITHDVRNATGGRGRVLTELGTFLHDIGGGGASPFDLLVIMVDANRKGLNRVIQETRRILSNGGYSGHVALGVPDPHVERWYLNDPQAIRAVVGASTPVVPRRTRQRDAYKNALRDSFRQAGIELYLDGAEYGHEIASNIDFYLAGQNDTSFRRFVDELRAGLRQLVISRRNGLS